MVGVQIRMAHSAKRIAKNTSSQRSALCARRFNISPSLNPVKSLLRRVRLKAEFNRASPLLSEA
jgi:hypothetical protein